MGYYSNKLTNQLVDDPDTPVVIAGFYLVFIQPIIWLFELIFINWWVKK